MSGFGTSIVNKVEDLRAELSKERKIVDFISSYSLLIMDVENLNKEILKLDKEVSDNNIQLKLTLPQIEEKKKLIDALNKQLKLLQE